MTSASLARNEAPTISRLAIGVIRLMMLIYDAITLPIYFLWQRPDRRRQAAHQMKSERVDDNTWIKKNAFNSGRDNSNSVRSRNDRNNRRSNKLNYHYYYPSLLSHDTGHSRERYKYRGSTLNDIFANSVAQHHNRPCLGYRALITCPVVAWDNHGKQTLVEKSFRSDYTWYTYDQIGRRVHDIASGLYGQSIFPESRALILADTSLEWFIAAHACFQLGVQLVLAQDISDTKILASILAEAQVTTIFISCSRLPKLVSLFKTIKTIQINDKQQQQQQQQQQQEVEGNEVSAIIKVNNIVLIDWQFTIDYDEPMFSQLKQNVLPHLLGSVLSMGKIEERGAENPIQMRCSPSLERHLSLDDDELLLNMGQDNSSLLSSNPRVDKRTLASVRNAEPNELAMIVYKYGSVAQLKAVLLTHECLARCNHYSFLDGMLHDDDIHCAVLPLDNPFEFITEMCLFSQGASIGYSCGPQTLFYDGQDLFGKRDRSDLTALAPTMLAVRPFMLERFRASIMSYIGDRINPIMAYLLTNVIYDYKRYWAKSYYETPLVDRLFCSSLGQLFGGRVQYILCNGCTQCSETKDFFAFMVNIPIVELYGQSEAIVSMMSSNTDVYNFHETKHGKEYDYLRERLLMDQSQGPQPDFQQLQLMPATSNSNWLMRESSKNLLITTSALCPMEQMRIRLEDWEDFRTTDLPYPRGRLLVGGDIVSSGYYRRPQLSDSVFYVDSNFITWFRTEDVAQALPNGTFEIISRMADLIKMADGHFISLGQVEQVVRNSQFVDNVCAICCQDRKFLIALVVPNLRRLALKSPGADDIKMAIGGIGGPEPEELNDIEFRREVCNDRLLCESVNRHLGELVAKAGLQAIPKRFHLVAEIWTPQSELVTPSLKPSRRAIEKYYASEIDTIFKTEFTPGFSGRRTQLLRRSRTASLRRRRLTGEV